MRFQTKTCFILQTIVIENSRCAKTNVNIWQNINDLKFNLFIGLANLLIGLHRSTLGLLIH